MSVNQELQINSLLCQMKAMKKELDAFRSGEKIQKLRREYEALLRERDLSIRKLQKERDEYSFSRKEITRQWLEVLEDVQKEHEKETQRLKCAIGELTDLVLSLKRLYAESEEKRKDALKNYYDTSSELLDAQGIIQKLTAQVNHDYQNSSLPSSKCIGRKKITNNREKTGKKPGAQPGHKHHPRKKMPKADKIIWIPETKEMLEDSRYVPTGKTIVRQCIGIAVCPVVTEYQTPEFYDKKKGRLVHAPFPPHAVNDVNYDETLKAVLFLLNSRCNVSLAKTSRFVSELTGGALTPSVGMINGLCREFSQKSKQEQDKLFCNLLDAPVMHVDGTSARVNGKNNTVIVCSNGDATMYFARESKGHAAVKGTPVESFGGILTHDHEACFYHYGSDHQECLVHVERYLRASIENEKNLTWSKKMLELVKEMIHENKHADATGIPEDRIKEFNRRYDDIIQLAAREYEDEPPSDYYRDGYNLYRRMAEYRHNHLLFLSNPLVAPDNNLCERKARVLKGKINQAVSLRIFDQLTLFCDSLSVLDRLAKDNGTNLYTEVKEIFRREKTASVSQAT